jgi:hypothetical protein|tara:strand:- start:38236 stop:39714 length:1479 start_codon:yes stop_codon:yes gene_type:complete
MKINYFIFRYHLILITLIVTNLSYGQGTSATNQVIVTSTNSYSGVGRGFRFTPNVNMNVTELGKRIPNTLGNYTWTIWNNSTNTIVHQQASTSNTAAVYTYEPISTPVQLLQGVSYSLMMYCDGTAGAQYYYGPSTQVNSQLTYTTAVFCNSCGPNNNSTGVVAGYHYGTPDFKFTTCTPGTSTDTRTECAGYIWLNGQTYNSNNNTATHVLPNAAANGCDSIITLDLTIIPTPMGIQTVTSCGPFLWINGYTYTISTQVAQYLIPGGAANGCDSLAKLHLTVLNPSTGTDTRTECAGFTWIDGNSYYTDTNSITHTIPNGAASGCDSIVTLNLTVYNVDVSLTVVDPTLTVNVTGTAYQWLDCGAGYAPIAGAISQSFVPTTNGIYAAKITENGCTDTSACTSIVSVGIEENSFFKNVTFSPNPSTGVVNFDFGDLKGLDINVFNTAGEKVFSEENINSIAHTIELNEASGVYFIELISKDQNQRYKLVLQ